MNLAYIKTLLAVQLTTLTKQWSTSVLNTRLMVASLYHNMELVVFRLIEKPDVDHIIFSNFNKSC